MKKQTNYMGRRLKRGLFLSSVGKVVQADVNGAINILRKGKGELLDPWVRVLACSCRVYRPRKLYFAGSGSFVLGEFQLARAG
ncbi:MAG: transposase [Oligoflexales bacterium]|nr:transposase [Oligoflexales bacterium]